MHNLLHGNRPSLLRFGFPLTAIAVMCFALSSLTHAVNPPPDGGYPGGNTAEGSGALARLTSGVWNTAVGSQALTNDTNGGANTATGYRALFNNTTGIGNAAFGSRALLNNVGGSNNVALGANAGSDIRGSNNIDIGHPGVSGDTSTIRIGLIGVQTDTFVSGIHGNILPDNGSLQPVFINNLGKLGTVLSPSSARFKDGIKTMGDVSEAILALKPVTFRYKKDIDSRCRPQFGLVAEEVAKVNADLVNRDEKGELFSVRYEAVNAMLLNEFLKAHRKIEEQDKAISQLKSGMEVLTATVKEQAEQIEKVSAQFEMSRRVPQVVVNK